MPWRGWESPWKIIRDFKFLLLPSIYKVSEDRKLLLHPTCNNLCSQQHGDTSMPDDHEVLAASVINSHREGGVGLWDGYQAPGAGQ